MLGIILIIIASLLVPGVIIRTKSIASGRKGPGLFQPLKDLRVLLRKGSVFSNTTGLIFRIAPHYRCKHRVCTHISAFWQPRCADYVWRRFRVLCLYIVFWQIFHYHWSARLWKQFRGHGG